MNPHLIATRIVNDHLNSVCETEMENAIEKAIIDAWSVLLIGAKDINID